MGMSGVMFLAATTSLIGAVFSFFFIPRTKDKSMYELELLFVKKKGTVGNNHEDISGCDLFDKESIMTAEKKIDGSIQK